MKIRKITEVRWGFHTRGKKELCFLWIDVNLFLLGMVATTKGGPAGTLKLKFQHGDSGQLGKEFVAKLWRLFSADTLPFCVKNLGVLEEFGEVFFTFSISKNGFCERAFEVAAWFLDNLGTSETDWFHEGVINQRTEVKTGKGPDGPWRSLAWCLSQKHHPDALGTIPV